MNPSNLLCTFVWHAILNLSSQREPGSSPRNGGGTMSVYEAITLMISFGALVALIMKK